ncbi:hypothetical protein BDR26DRAFT_879646, partial [Obelidium mucronatum]
SSLSAVSPAEFSRATIEEAVVRRCHHSWGNEYYPVSAYVISILCFPCGILCCFRMKEKKCRLCGLCVDVEYVEPSLNDDSYRLGFAIGAWNATQNQG